MGQTFEETSLLNAIERTLYSGELTANERRELSYGIVWFIERYPNDLPELTARFKGYFCSECGLIMLTDGKTCRNPKCSIGRKNQPKRKKLSADEIAAAEDTALRS